MSRPDPLAGPAEPPRRIDVYEFTRALLGERPRPRRAARTRPAPAVAGADNEEEST